MKELKNIYHYIFYALVVTIPFEDDIRIVPNILLGLLAVVFPFVIKRAKIKNKTSYALAIALILFLSIKSLVFETFFNDMYVIKKSFILIAVLILSLPIEKPKKVMLAFILSVALLNVISLINIGFFVYTEGGFKIATGNAINKILVVERLYFGLINCMSIAFTLKVLPSIQTKFKKHLISGIVFSLFLILLVASRMAIIICIALFLIKLFSRTTVKKGLLFIVLISGFIVTFFALNNNLSKRFLYADKKNDFIHNIKAWEPRFVIWNCAFDTATSDNHNLLFGDGFYNTQNNLNSCYKETIVKKKRLTWFMERQFNTHNQYLDFLLSAGIIGLVVFLVLILLIFKKIRKDLDLVNILLVLLFFGLIENFLHRQIGVYLLSLILVILSISSPNDKRLNE